MKKISILGLHLGYGGVEQAIINQANMLCNNYQVELVVTYKLLDNPAFKIDSKIKVIYLTDLKPNREEFLDCLRHRKFIQTIKEGFKSIKILIKKKSTMKKYLKKCDSNIIISSRVEIAEILSKIHKPNVITITEEHRHHNNDIKYIKRLYNATKNIDYLVCVSKELTNYYTEKIPHIKTKWIPNALDYNNFNKSKLNNKNIVSIGRLSHEKGFEDLIEVFNLILDFDKECHLDIIGDGNEKENIIKKIKDLKLENKVTLHGFQNKEYINNILLHSTLYIMTSYEESFGTVLIEAASFGVPAIAFSSAQGANEIIVNGKSGYLIKDRNKKEMAKKVIELINDNNKLKEFGMKAYEIANEFSFNKVKDEWLQFLEEVL